MFWPHAFSHHPRILVKSNSCTQMHSNSLYNSTKIMQCFHSVWKSLKKSGRFSNTVSYMQIVCIGILTTSKGIFFQVPIFSKMILVVAGLDFCVVFGSVNSISNALTGTGKIGCCFDLRGWNGLLATKELALLAFMRWGAMILVTEFIRDCHLLPNRLDTPYWTVNIALPLNAPTTRMFLSVIHTLGCVPTSFGQKNSKKMSKVKICESLYTYSSYARRFPFNLTIFLRFF